MNQMTRSLEQNLEHLHGEDGTDVFDLDMVEENHNHQGEPRHYRYNQANRSKLEFKKPLDQEKKKRTLGRAKWHSSKVLSVGALTIDKTQVEKNQRDTSLQPDTVSKNEFD